MKTITLSADEALIEAAEKRAREEHTTLDEEFRRWLVDYAICENDARSAFELIERIQGYAKTGGRRFTRDEMNAR